MAGELASLVNDERLIAYVVVGIEEAIAWSFGQDAVRDGHEPRMSNAEVKRRFDMCVKIFKILRGDLGWSVDRIIDRLPRLLRAELDGVQWNPDNRSMWTPYLQEE